MADDQQIQVTITADASDLTQAMQTASSAVQASLAALGQTAQSVNVQINELGSNTQKNSQKGQQAIADWTRSFTNFDGAFSSSITAMVTGTETWQKAVRRISQTALSDFVGLAQKRLAHWLASELGMTAGTEAGTAARTAAEQTADTTSLASVALKALQMIATDAAQTFAGVFAFLSPVLGPAAAGPAAASQATVLEAGSMVVASAAGGLWSVPSDMLALVHKQESILPAGVAQPMRDFFSGGPATSTGQAGNVAITIQAIDTQSGAQFLMNNAGVIAQGLAREIRN
ncbi:MAG TPA: hypothetical protein VKV32_17145, partial [Stellaceae bacterium]|nr:hypothetical protein [Stellaceae bacterium]